MLRPFLRRPDIYRLGLTQADIDNRGVIVAGYAKKELLPSYKWPAHQKRAEEILAYVDQIEKSNRVLKIDISAANIPVQEEFPDTKVIEVVGAFVVFCVYYALQSVTDNGLIGLVNSQLLLPDQPGQSDFSLERKLLSSQKDLDNTSLKIAKKTFLIYKPSK